MVSVDYRCLCRHGARSGCVDLLPGKPVAFPRIPSPVHAFAAVHSCGCLDLCIYRVRHKQIPLVLYRPEFPTDIPIQLPGLFSFLGYATHGLLDACTSYGTQLFWPFSDIRVAWNSVSIIDPFFTLPIVVLVAASAIRKRSLYARIAFVYAVIFLSAGVMQKMRAEQSLYELAESRGHQIKRKQVKPTFANRHVWKLIYESDDRYYVDAVRLLLEPAIIEGDSIRKLDAKRDFPWLPQDSQHAQDIERFRWFSDDFVAVHKDDPSVIFDVRYSFVPNQIDMMWGIELDPQAIKQGMLRRHVTYQMRSTQEKSKRDAFINMVIRF